MDNNTIEDIINILIKNTKDEEEKSYLEGLLNYPNDKIDLDTLDKISEYETNKVLKKD